MDINIFDLSTWSYLSTFFTEHPEAFVFCVGLFSLFIGSFLNVVIYRLPRMMQNTWHEECRIYLGLKPHSHQELEQLSLALPFSHCPHCKKTLKPWHNVPVFSYLFLFGKCAYCRASISLRYPIVELITAVSSVYIAWSLGFSFQTGGALLFTWILITLTFIDLDYYLLPDQLSLLLLWLGLFCSLFSLFCSSHDAIIGAIVGYSIFAAIEWVFKKITGKSGLGQGDFKLLAALGAYLGWQQLPIIVLAASFIGAIFGITHMFIRRQFKSIPLPFGPYLAFAGWISLLWGNELMSLYWQYMLR